MTKDKRKRRRSAHRSGPVTPNEEAILGELEARANEIAQSDPENAGPLRGAAHKLLLKTAADPAEVAALVTTRDADGLGRLVRVLRGLETTPLAAAEGGDPATAAGEIPPETLKKALRAFRKRLKLTRLADESRLGVGPMTSGRKADFDAIMAPQEFPPEVWEALVAEGKLRQAGRGFYMLAETPLPG
jgi:hypothetical protein